MKQALLAVFLITSLAGPAEARLGESFDAFLHRFTVVSKSLKPLAQLPGVSTQNFTFEANVPLEQKKASVGFAIGVTVTVMNGKIVGQSLAVKPGNNVFVGQKLAGLHGFSFAYEAIGKTIPPERAKAEPEFKAFCNAVDRACMGEEQFLRYPGFKALITIRTDPTSGNVLIAATPDMPIQPNQPAR